MTTLTEDLAAENLQRMNNDELLAHLIERLPAIREALRPAPMTDQTEREKFERYYSDTWGFTENPTKEQQDIFDRKYIAAFKETQWDVWQARAALDGGAVSRNLHPETSALIDRFSEALKDKLAAAEKKYGYSDGWANEDWQAELIEKLQHHIIKGDPRDVAAYCAFAWHHGWSVTPPQRDGGAVSQDEINSIAAKLDDYPAFDKSVIADWCRFLIAALRTPQPSSERDLLLRELIAYCREQWKWEMAPDYGNSCADDEEILSAFLASRQEKCNG